MQNGLFTDIFFIVTKQAFQHVRGRVRVTGHELAHFSLAVTGERLEQPARHGVHSKQFLDRLAVTVKLCARHRGCCGAHGVPRERARQVDVRFRQPRNVFVIALRQPLEQGFGCCRVGQHVQQSRLPFFCPFQEALRCARIGQQASPRVFRHLREHVGVFQDQQIEHGIVQHGIGVTHRQLKQGVAGRVRVAGHRLTHPCIPVRGQPPQAFRRGCRIVRLEQDLGHDLPYTPSQMTDVK